MNNNIKIAIDTKQTAIKKLHDYLAKSPSMIYPQDVLEYLPAIEEENDKLRKLVELWMHFYFMPSAIDCKQRETELLERARELGIEKDNGELWAR